MAAEATRELSPAETTGQESVPTTTMVDVPLLPGSTSAARPLVGRRDELTTLAGLIGIRPVDGLDPVRAVLLAGDAGVGKTRLLTELRDLAFTEGWQVVAGHSLDFGDSALPYLPFSEVIGRLATDAPALVDTIAERHPALGRLRPGRRLLSEHEPTLDSAADSAVDRGALYDAVHALLEATAAERPLLLVIEDTHWADRSSRDLLSFLFSRPFESPVAIVASYRSDDLHRRHPLRKVAAEWARIPGVARMQLNPLPSEDVRALVHQLHPTPLTEAEIAGIVQRADGNAFFVEELVGATRLAQSLPDDLAELLLVRLDQLGDEAQAVVRTAAVAGRQVSHDLLAASSNITLEALDVGLRDAIGHNVLVPARGESYAFRHALLAEAVYDDLLPGERARLHAAYASALAGNHGRGTAAELARHARAAHDLATAFDASIRAGDEAMSVGGPEEASRHYEAALELMADPALPQDVAVDLASLGTRAIDALLASGNAPRSLSLAQSLLESLPADAPPAWRGQLLVAMVPAVLYTETQLDPRDYTGEALRLIPDEPSSLRARALHVHALALDAKRDFTAAREIAVEALSMAESLDQPRLGSDVLTTLAGIQRRAGGESDEDIEAAIRNVATVAEQAGAMATEVRAIWLLGRWHFDHADYVAAREAFERAVHRADALGRPWSPYALDARLACQQVAYLLGNWDTVIELADLTGQMPPPIPEALLSAGRLTVQAGRGETDARLEAARLRPFWDKEGLVPVTAGPPAIELHALAGDRDAALAEHDDVVGTLSRIWREFFHARVRISAVTVGALAHGIADESAETRALVAAQVDKVVQGAENTVRHLREVGDEWGPEGAAWVLRLRAEKLRFRWLAGIDAPSEDELVQALRADLAGFEAMGHVYEVARSQTRLALVLHTAGDQAEARILGDQARTTAQRLGARPLLDDLRAAGRTPQRGRGSTRDEQLTPRELEILALVATGRSNGEIGKQLFISTKTVSVHVSNILAKLGAAGRTEAAAIARRTGLLD
jgi:DNA-binding NarL/FixJ family response regulator/tetratricopeptide (TPR) repeat protein